GRRTPARDRRRQRLRHRRRRGRARPRREAAPDAVAARHAGRPVRREADPARAGPEVPVLRQGHDGDDRAPGRRRPDRPDPAHGLDRLARVAGRAPLLPDRIREPAPGGGALGLVLPAPRPARALDPAGRAARRISREWSGYPTRWYRGSTTPIGE